MSQDDRAAFAEALEPARQAAYPPGEYVGQESFMRASEIRELAWRAGIAPGVSVLDLCCGVAGPGRYVTAELGCDYLGLDRSAGAVTLARSAAGDLPCRFEVSSVPPLPAGPFDVVMLLETLLAFPVKRPLLSQVAAVLRRGGRCALTAEEGDPLTRAERSLMPGAHTVWPIRLPELVDALHAVGLEVRWTCDLSAAHREMVEWLADSFVADRSAIAGRIGPAAVDHLITAHRVWGEWLGSGRVRKFALVAEKAPGTDGPSEPPGPSARSPR